jgi:hypothetical protein
VLGHVSREATGRRPATECFRKRSNMVRPCAAADAEIADIGRRGLPAEFGDFVARRLERIERHREGPPSGMQWAQLRSFSVKDWKVGSSMVVR